MTMLLVSDEECARAMQYLVDTAPVLAEAEATFKYLEDFTKAVLAKLSDEQPGQSAAASKSYAERHPAYERHLQVVREAREKYLKLRFLIDAAKVKVEVWRTSCANVRGIH